MDWGEERKKEKNSQYFILSRKLFHTLYTHMVGLKIQVLKKICRGTRQVFKKELSFTSQNEPALKYNKSEMCGYHPDRSWCHSQQHRSWLCPTQSFHSSPFVLECHVLPKQSPDFRTQHTGQNVCNGGFVLKKKNQ
jgi:hypothetical protein